MNWTDKVRAAEDRIEAFRQTAEDLRKYEPQGEDLVGGLDWSKEPDIARFEQAREMLAPNNLLARDAPTAINELEELAARGSIASMWYLGWAFERGKVVPVNKARAEKWFRLGAEQGPLSMRRNLAAFYMNDNRFAEAKPILELLTEQNFPPGVRMLGRMYANGLGVERDIPKARELLERASASGNIRAKILLAKYWMSGKFGKKRRLRAFVLAWQATRDKDHLESVFPSSSRLL